MLTLIVKAIKFIYFCGLVISPQKEEVLGILDLVSKQKDNSLDRLLASIDIISKEQVIFLRRKPTIIENFQQILKLAMNITNYFDGRL